MVLSTPEKMMKQSSMLRTMVGGDLEEELDSPLKVVEVGVVLFFNRISWLQRERLTFFILQEGDGRGGHNGGPRRQDVGPPEI